MDLVYGVELYGLSDDEERDKKMELRVEDISQYAEIEGNGIKFFVGGVGVLD